MEELKHITAPLTQDSAVALGFFDGVHLGHRAVLRAAAQCAAEQGLMACALMLLHTTETSACDPASRKNALPIRRSTGSSKRR